ncbi:hypothetical protein BT69DRAFT_561552 [Atractiella rhizophila]|nr:hypothetical protein BT69DRAFT_561552 [Atractiella rhizophila]
MPFNTSATAPVPPSPSSMQSCPLPLAEVPPPPHPLMRGNIKDEKKWRRKSVPILGVQATRQRSSTTFESDESYRPQWNPIMGSGNSFVENRWCGEAAELQTKDRKSRDRTLTPQSVNHLKMPTMDLFPTTVSVDSTSSGSTARDEPALPSPHLANGMGVIDEEMEFAMQAYEPPDDPGSSAYSHKASSPVPAPIPISRRPSQAPAVPPKFFYDLYDEDETNKSEDDDEETFSIGGASLWERVNIERVISDKEAYFRKTSPYPENRLENIEDRRFERYVGSVDDSDSSTDEEEDEPRRGRSRTTIAVESIRSASESRQCEDEEALKMHQQTWGRKRSGTQSTTDVGGVVPPSLSRASAVPQNLGSVKTKKRKKSRGEEGDMRRR